jgi:hypothetical protein
MCGICYNVLCVTLFLGLANKTLSRNPLQTAPPKPKMPHILESRVQKQISVEAFLGGCVVSAGESAGDFGDDYSSVS